MTLNNSSYILSICWICLFLAEVCEARFRATRFRFRYTTYSSYGSYGSSSSLGAGAIAGIVSGSIVFTIILICIIVCCCSRSKEGANKGVVLQYNPANKQQIVTSNSMAGVTYPSKASANMATPGVNFPSQAYPQGAQYNTAFQYGIQDPKQRYDTYSGQQFDNAPPSYKSTNGHNRSAVSPYQTQGKMLVSNIKMPSQQKE
ncbi:uncharacterized protein LOC134282633 [Saccostrea cucullata]|uniref:uncharacterized protein LOC134282633 n=1 Tax=Saccostrea cuccullata TaxID=36930 RepID=UPI002ED3F1B2